MQNVEQTIISQYGNSSIIVQLINNMNQYIDQTANIDAFLNYVWNVDTAQGFGLDIWGRIVGVTRNIPITNNNYFGFVTGSSPETSQPFNDGSFYTGAASTSTFTLADDPFRTLILAKALTNIVSCTAPAINQVLQNLFPGRGRCYVSDLGGMMMRYTFEFALQPWELSVIASGIALPRSAGVGAIAMVIPVTSTFGFQEAGASASPFGQGTFFNEGTILNVA